MILRSEIHRLGRWIRSSLAIPFSATLETKYGYRMFVENDQRQRTRVPVHTEFRMDGPRLIELSRNYWDCYVEVNILAQVVIDPSGDLYTIDDVCGAIAEAFVDHTCYKYGPLTSDDQSFVGCLILQQDRGSHERIQINHFGQIEPETNLLQASVEGHYRMYLNTE